MHPRQRLARVSRWNSDGFFQPDRVVLEEPLQITLRSDTEEIPLATILRTPGHDFELVHGYLYALGLMTEQTQIQEISYCSRPQDYNRVKVHFRGALPPGVASLRSPEWVHGGCGACGQQQIDPRPPHRVQLDSTRPEATWLRSLPQQLRSMQTLFQECGGSHAAALGMTNQPLDLVREDVGRHNAVDKLVGYLWMNQHLPAHQRWLVLSGRAGFELVQKAVLAGFCGVASLGPPSSLAVRYAEQAQLALVGFLNSERFNVYVGQAAPEGPQGS